MSVSDGDSSTPGPLIVGGPGGPVGGPGGPVGGPDGGPVGGPDGGPDGGPALMVDLMVDRRVDLMAVRREALLEGQLVDPQVVLVVKEGLSVSQGEVSAAQMVDPQVVLVVHLADLVARLVAQKVAWEGRWVAKEVLQVAQREELGASRRRWQGS